MRYTVHQINDGEDELILNYQELNAEVEAVLVFMEKHLVSLDLMEPENPQFISPFSYANATSIFSNAETDMTALILGAVIIVSTTLAAGTIYTKRDLAS